MDAKVEYANGSKIFPSADDAYAEVIQGPFPIRLSAEGVTFYFRNEHDVSGHFGQFRENAQGEVALTYVS